jgi:hypothetical protein
MTIESPAAINVAPRRVVVLTLVAAVVATAITFLAFLPAEYGYDPTGFGQLTGLNRIAAAQPVTVAAVAPAAAGGGTAARAASVAYRSDSIDIALPPDGELEYKVQMKSGDSLVYSWDVEGFENREWFYYDFHGETWPRPEGEKAKIAEYEQKTGVNSSGSLIAPFEGVHGWYLQNQGGKPVTVHLKMSGFYQLIPPGEYGNLEGIQASAAAK